jgi:NADPH:quinone reductase-like Zn-dependent oxidoreductase
MVQTRTEIQMKAIVQDKYGSPGMKYRRVVVTRHGGPDVLQVVEEDLPEPQAGEVRVKVLAAGVSAYDLMLRRSGSVPGTPRVPFTPGVDIVGLADELGEGVSTVQPGQMLAASASGGGYAEFICLPASELVPVPSGVDLAEAVCLVANYLTDTWRCTEPPGFGAASASWSTVRREAWGPLCSSWAS